MKRMFATALLLTAAAALAQTGTVKNGVRFILNQDLIRSVTADGKTTETVIQSPKTVVPGDILREEISVQNVSGKLLSGVTVGIPVPKGTEFSGQATPGTDRWKLTYSTDLGKTYSAQPMTAVTTTEGGKSVTKQVPAPVSTYTNVRWTVATINVDETLKLGFRVKVK